MPVDTLRASRIAFQVLVLVAVFTGLFTQNFLLFFLAVALAIIAFVFQRIRQKEVVVPVTVETEETELEVERREGAAPKPTVLLGGSNLTAEQLKHAIAVYTSKLREQQQQQQNQKTNAAPHLRSVPPYITEPHSSGVHAQGELGTKDMNCWWTVQQAMIPLAQKAASSHNHRDLMTRVVSKNKYRDIEERMIMQNVALRPPPNTQRRR